MPASKRGSPRVTERKREGELERLGEQRHAALARFEDAALRVVEEVEAGMTPSLERPRSGATDLRVVATREVALGERGVDVGEDGAGQRRRRAGSTREASRGPCAISTA